MWSSWSTSTNRKSCHSHSDPTFTFEDVQSVINEQDPQQNSQNKISSIFHRIRITSNALRDWKASLLPKHPPIDDEKKVILYFTSLRILRKTFQDCRTVRSILRGFRVLIYERDLSMDSGFLEEWKGVRGMKNLSLPAVFIGGKYVGGAEEIKQLHESGDLKKMMEGIPIVEGGSVCISCGELRFVLCSDCNGSHKLYENLGFKTCRRCNENGLIRCPDCCKCETTMKMN